MRKEGSNKMAVNKDWLPNKRAEQLAMAQNWKAVLTVRAGGWNIPIAVLTNFTALLTAAAAALAPWGPMSPALIP
jgi:hypothetical protein